MKRLLFISFLTATTAAYPRISPPDSTPVIQHGKSELRIQASDGIPLGTTVFLPKGKGKFPAVLVRTPYNRSADEWLGKAFNRFGIAVVLQDVRGRYQSGGDFYPFIHEREDGLSTLRWIRAQSWSDGKIAGWGGSYVGYTQWAISDSLDFMTLLVTGANVYDLSYPDGLFSLQTTMVWGLQNAANNTTVIPAEKLKAGSLILPISAIDDSVTRDIAFINDWVRHEKYDSFWETMNHRGISRAPVLSMAGWYDIFLKSQITDFQALVANGSTGSRLVIGPWCHGSMGEKNDYGGVRKTGSPVKAFWYVKNRIKGKDPVLKSPLKEARYNLFVMERNEYVGSEVWPPDETRITPYFIGPSGYLGQSVYKENGDLAYRYSPEDPYPSLGGTALGEGVGPARQNLNLDRKDQLVFESEIAEPMVLLGPVSATLYLGSDARCTDFIVGIQDVFPDGKIINIQEGGARISFENDDPRKTEISVWATGYQLNGGHRLRMVISSSWFPRYNRNLNTCEPAEIAANMVPALQKVYYGPATPSCINLPLYNPREK